MENKYRAGIRGVLVISNPVFYEVFSKSSSFFESSEPVSVVFLFYPALSMLQGSWSWRRSRSSPPPKGGSVRYGSHRHEWIVRRSINAFAVFQNGGLVL